MKIDTNLSWQYNVNDLSIKPNRTNAPLFKMRKYVSQRIVILQKETVRIINFQPRNSHTSPLFKQSSILKFQDKVCLENILFVSKSLDNLSPSVFNTWFSFSSDQHNYETSSVLHRVTSQNFFIRQIDVGIIQ